MNFLGWVVLMVVVELTVFSYARTTHAKFQICKDDDALGVINSTIHAIQKGENADDRSIKKQGIECLQKFALNGQPPIFPSNLNTVAVCQRLQQNQDAEYATYYDIQRRMPLYSLYQLPPLAVNLIGSFPRPPGSNTWFQNSDIPNHLQGSNALYEMQPTPRRIERGHLAPFQTLSYSEASGLASFSYLNAVPQYGTFNRRQWLAYERRIRQFARNECAERGGSLYLITGTSPAHLLGQGGPVQRQSMDTLPSQPGTQPYLSIPNSMWTVGCCVSPGGVVLGAFAVIGNNVPQADQVFMSNSSVTQVQEFIRTGANDPTIQLFPGNLNCYAATNQFYF